MITESVYLDKLTRFNKTLNNGIPDRVPVLSTADVWVPANAGVSLKDAYIDDPAVMKDSLKWFSENVYVDVHWHSGLLHPFVLGKIFNGGLYVVSDESFQIIAGGSAILNPEEYPEYIKNNVEFSENVLVPRKYKIFNELSEDQAADMIANGIKAFMQWGQISGMINEYCKEELGMPIIVKGVILHPMDYLLDVLRDFRGIMTDLRRYPEQVRQALEVIYPVIMAMPIGSGAQPNDETGVVFDPMHVPTFLNPKQFNEFYFPYMKKLLEDMNDGGFRMLYFCEDDWTPFIDNVCDLRPGNNAFIFEKGDLRNIKNRISSIGTFVGGLSNDILKNGTMEECIDNAKWCLDELAPGYKYMCAPGKTFVDKYDVAVEKYAAVCNYVHENGVY